MDDEEEALISPRGKRHGFWTAERMLFAAVFIAGLLIGAFATHQYIEPMIFAAKSSDSNALAQLNDSLDKRNDQLYSCLLENNIKPDTCTG